MMRKNHRGTNQFELTMRDFLGKVQGETGALKDHALCSLNART